MNRTITVNLTRNEAKALLETVENFKFSELPDYSFAGTVGTALGVIRLALDDEIMELAAIYRSEVMDRKEKNNDSRVELVKYVYRNMDDKSIGLAKKVVDHIIGLPSYMQTSD